MNGTNQNHSLGTSELCYYFIRLTILYMSRVLYACFWSEKYIVQLYTNVITLWCKCKMNSVGLHIYSPIVRENTMDFPECIAAKYSVQVIMWVFLWQNIPGVSEKKSIMKDQCMVDMGADWWCSSRLFSKYTLQQHTMLWPEQGFVW